MTGVPITMDINPQFSRKKNHQNINKMRKLLWGKVRQKKVKNEDSRREGKLA